MYQQVVPIEIYAVNKQPYIHNYVSVSILIYIYIYERHGQAYNNKKEVKMKLKLSILFFLTQIDGF